MAVLNISEDSKVPRRQNLLYGFAIMFACFYFVLIDELQEILRLRRLAVVYSLLSQLSRMCYKLNMS